MNDQFKSLLIKKEGPIGFITLNRPKKLNALNSVVLKELPMAARWFNDQLEIKVVIINGAGRTFSAGADIKDSPFEAENLGWIEKREQAQLGIRMTEAIGNMRAITIAQVHGFAIGGAFLLMLACDFRIVEENAFFSIPEVDLGIPLSWGGVPKLVAEIGPSRTKDLVISCRRFYPEEAKSWGLINNILKKDELASYCLEFAQQLADKPAIPVFMTKEQVNAVAKNIGAAYVRTSEADMLQWTRQEPEALAAAKAYLEKLKRQN